MSTEVTNQEPVLVLDDKKYVISELSDTAKYMVQSLNNLQQKIALNRMEHDQFVIAQEGFTSRLRDEVEKEPEEIIVEEESSN